MVKTVTIICICLLSLHLLGIETELTELYLDDLIDRYWEELADSPVLTRSIYEELSFYSAVNTSDIGGEPHQRLSNRFALQNKSINFELYQYSDMKQDQHHYNAGLCLYPQVSYCPQINLGSYRYGFGRGLLMGHRGSAKEAVSLRNASNPRTYSPFGTAVVFRIGEFRLSPFMSVQYRAANIADSLITSIPKSKTTKGAEVQERIYGTSLSYQKEASAIGILLYHQDYDKAFEESLSKGIDNAVSIYFKHGIGRLGLSSETFLSGNHHATTSSMEYGFDGLKHSIRYSDLPVIYAPVFANNQFKLGSGYGKRELEYNLDYKPMPYLQGRISYALLMPYNSIKASDTKARGSLFLACKQSRTTHSLSISRFDRELVSSVDSVFVHSLPQHYRFHYNLDHAVRPAAAFRLRLSYHYEEKSRLEQNTVLWDSSFRVFDKKRNIRLGIQSWYTLNHLYNPALDQYEPQGYDILKKSDTMLYLNAGFPLAKLRIKLGYQHYLNNPGNSRINLSFAG